MTDWHALFRARGGADTMDTMDKTPTAPGCVNSVNCVTRRENPRSVVETWDATDWRGEYDERAAIYEFDGNRPRAQAEAMAWQHIAALWYRRHGDRTPAALCAGCHKPLSGAKEVLLLPHGERAHADPTYACITAYGRRWRGAAAAALTAMGIRAPDPDDLK